MVSVYFRHASVRPQQDALVKDVCEALSQGKIILCHAPTGLGKTDAALGAALTFAQKEGAPVLFLTPKTSQHGIAVEVVNGIVQKYGLELKGTDVVGKKHMCADPALSRARGEEFYLACQKRRKNAACPFYANTRGFGRAQEARASAAFEGLAKSVKGALHHHEAAALARGKGMCGYEFALRLGERSGVIIADYSQLFVPGIRDAFLRKTGKRLGELVVIVDEAHNVAPRIREYLSASANSLMLSRAAKEAKALGSPLDLRALSAGFDGWAEARLGKAGEAEASREELLPLLPGEIGALATAFEDLGVEFIEKQGKPVSALLRLSVFLHAWNETDSSSVRILRKAGPAGYSLSKRCLDPSPLAGVLNSARAAVLMSGTLVPLEMHRDVLGLDARRAVMREYSSPFSALNRINVIARGFTTKFTRRQESEYEKMGKEIARIIGATPGKVGVFFPAFNVMRSVLPFIPNRGLLVQGADMPPRDVSRLFERFVEEDGATLCGVQGGSLSEGIDYPGGVMKCAVMAGVPLQEMDVEVKSLIDYYEARMGKGWEYGYIYPAVIKSIQAAGRCVRSERDRAAMVYLDERFAWGNYRKCFPKDFDFVLSAEPSKVVAKFFSGPAPA
ncbi:MAG: ATP-dependent DNA helicase [Candidatus ainarchaeum sp.]|nr:ATP-dependent DNA helicase [Candidatus ainarchaeum sp.]